MKSNARSLLETKEFVFVATSDTNGMPNVAPKFLLKISRRNIFLVDYTISKTWENMKVNPQVSLATIDSDTLTGYRINGTSKILDKGPVYGRLLRELRRKEVHFTATRVIEGLHTGKKSTSFEISFPEHVAIYKVAVQSVAEIGPSGTVKLEQATPPSEGARSQGRRRYRSNFKENCSKIPL